MSSKIYNSSLVAIHIIREAVTLKTPAYVGMSILDLSETLVYDFKYSYIESKYHDKEKLLFTDTDSLTYEIDTEDVYKDFWADKNKFHNSYMQKIHHSSTKRIRKSLENSKMKHPEFVGLRLTFR